MNEYRQGNRHLCRQCRTGIAPGQTPTFDPNCPRCHEKVAAGLRTGKEPNPREMFRPARMGAKNFAAKVRREKDARERRRTDYLATLPSRCAS